MAVVAPYYPNTDQQITNWAAVAMLEFDKGTPERSERRQRQIGVRAPTLNNDLWKEIQDLAEEKYGGTTPQELARRYPTRAKKAALTCPRAFCMFCNIQDDDGNVMDLKTFHIQAIRTMRQYPLSVTLLPFMHGKSYIASILIPLMDWAEQVESTQIRIYHSQQFTAYWTRKLMGIVENNQEIKILFPWIRKPEKGDPCEKIWSTRGFSIGGKEIVDPSFRPLTLGAYTVGVRADRVICDDWVNEKNAASQTQQDQFVNYFKTGAMTMRRFRRWTSPYETRWGTLGLIGTVFDKRDVNYRMFETWNKIQKKSPQREVKATRVSVYPKPGSRERGIVIWPEYRPFPYIQQLEKDLGRRAFRMRCMNRPLDDEEVVFKDATVRGAVREDLKFGELPQMPRQHIMIGFDPASGRKHRRTKSNANAFPAAVVMAFQEDQAVHFVEWARWSIPQPEQCRRLVEWSRKFQCPIVVESNNLQRSYSEWIKEMAPDVKVIHHWTGGVKHDPVDGVESFQPLFENGMVRIHADGAPELELKGFLDEWLDWPQGRYRDLVMASWITRYQYRLAHKSDNINQQGNSAPPYVAARGLSRVVDLSAYR